MDLYLILFKSCVSLSTQLVVLTYEKRIWKNENKMLKLLPCNALVLQTFPINNSRNARVWRYWMFGEWQCDLFATFMNISSTYSGVKWRYLVPIGSTRLSCTTAVNHYVEAAKKKTKNISLNSISNHVLRDILIIDLVKNIKI